MGGERGGGEEEGEKGGEEGGGGGGGGREGGGGGRGETDVELGVVGLEGAGADEDAVVQGAEVVSEDEGSGAWRGKGRDGENKYNSLPSKKYQALPPSVYPSVPT